MTITDPRDVPGLVAWYSAEAETGYSSGAIMTGWTDQSGNGHDAISASGATRPTWQAADGPSAGPAVKFPRDSSASGGYFVLPNMLAGLSSAHILVGIRADPTSNSVNGHWTLSPFPGGNDGNYYPHAGVVYESFGLSTNQRQNFTPSLSITSWRTYDVWSTAGDWGARLDGTTQATYASGTPAWVTQPLLGRASSVGVNQEAWKGWMAWVVILDHKATATEYADLVDYFTTNPSGGIPGAAPSPTTGTLSAVLPVLSASLSGGVTYSGTIAATLPPLGANLSGTSLPPGIAGTLSAALPPLGGSLAGAYSDTATLAAILPPLSADLTGTYAPPPATGALSATLPGLAANLAGQAFEPGTAGFLAAALPALTASLSGDVLGRTGLGLALDSSAVLTVDAPLEPEPTLPPGTPSTALHIIAPTVPVPTLVAGRPQ